MATKIHLYFLTLDGVPAPWSSDDTERGKIAFGDDISSSVYSLLQ